MLSDGQGYGGLPIPFDINAGQFDAEVKFAVQGRAHQLLLTGKESILKMQRLAQRSRKRTLQKDVTGTPQPITK